MAIGGIGTTGYTVGYETRRMERNTAGKNFAEEIEKTVNVDNIAACNKTFELQGDGAILSTIHVQTGESIGIYYDEEAGGNHMVAKVKGTDGSEKEIKIDPDEVDPSNASYVEMLALSAHLKQQGKIDSPAGGIVAMTMAKRVQEANARQGEIYDPPLTSTASSSGLPVPKEFMADAEKVGRGLADHVWSKKFVICHSFSQSLQMKLCYCHPLYMGKMMWKMTQRAI